MSIADGRALVETYRAKHDDAHATLDGDALAAEHVALLDELRRALGTLGYASVKAFFNASRAQDAAQGLAEDEWWR